MSVVFNHRVFVFMSVVFRHRVFVFMSVVSCSSVSSRRWASSSTVHRVTAGWKEIPHSYTASM